jgi:hypothetical protein
MGLLYFLAVLLDAADLTASSWEVEETRPAMPRSQPVRTDIAPPSSRPVDFDATYWLGGRPLSFLCEAYGVLRMLILAIRHWANALRMLSTRSG